MGDDNTENIERRKLLERAEDVLRRAEGVIDESVGLDVLRECTELINDIATHLLPPAG